MVEHEIWILPAVVASLFLCGWHLCWAHVDPATSRGWWARHLGIGAVIALGCTGLAAALLRSSWLFPLGLIAGLFIVVMLWESPEPTLSEGK